MEVQDKQASKLERAYAQVEREKGFYSHLAAYILVNLNLYAVYFFTDNSNHWYIWPMLGWGVGLASHGMKVFGKIFFLGKDWEERRVKKIMQDD